MRPQSVTTADTRGKHWRRPAGWGLAFGSLVLLLLTTLTPAHAQGPYGLVWWTTGSQTQSQGADYTLTGAVHPMPASALQGGNYRLGNPVGVSVFQTFKTAPTAQLLTTTTLTVRPDVGAQTNKQYLPLIVAETQ